MIRVPSVTLLAFVAITGFPGMAQTLAPAESIANAQQIVVRSQVIEIDRKKMRKLGFDLSVLRDDSSVFTRTASDGDLLACSLQCMADKKPSCGKCACSAFFDGLRKNGIARVLADPTITIVAGQRGAITIGSTVEVGKADQAFVGTKLQVLPKVDNDRIRVDYHLEHTSLVEGAGDDASTSPDVTQATFATETTFEVASGETFVSGGLLHPTGANEDRGDREIILLVTPELVERKLPRK